MLPSLLLLWSAPFGADPSLWERYKNSTNEAEKMFVCFDGKKTIPLDRINDNYADCADGSDEPGTSASTVGIFYCQNAKNVPKRILKWSVGDGICDCCDGSDEAFNKHSKCIPFCDDLEKERKTLLLSVEEIFKEGIAKRNDLLAQGTKIYQKNADHMKESTEKTKDLLSLIEVKESELANYTIQIDSKIPIPFIHHLYEFTFGRNRTKRSFTSAILEANIKDLKEKNSVFLKETNKAVNYSKLSGEELMLLPFKDQVYKIDRVTFTLIGDVCDNQNTLGHFRNYQNKNIFYENGDFCDVVNKSRKAEVKLECWKNNYVRSFSEPNICEYLIEMGSPLGCDENDIKNIQSYTVDNLTELKKRYQ